MHSILDHNRSERLAMFLGDAMGSVTITLTTSIPSLACIAIAFEEMTFDLFEAFGDLESLLDLVVGSVVEEPM